MTRAFIQGPEYNDEIDTFIMVGTPNLGSCNPYYIWEGGNPKLLDDLTDGIILSLTPHKPFLDVYTNTIKKMWNKTYKKWGWFVYDFPSIQKFVQAACPSLLQLMGTNAFLYQWDGESSFSPKFISTGTSGDNNNLWLKRLNSGNAILNMTPPAERMNADGSDGKVHTRILVGNMDDSTIERILVRTPNDLGELYEDGKPYYIWPASDNIKWGNGDGTVPLDSAIYPETAGWAKRILSKDIEEEHSVLIKAYSENIVAFLKGEPQPTSRTARSSESDVASIMSIALFGSVRACLTDPQNNRSGILPDQGTWIEEIPQSKSNFLYDLGGIQVENPMDGTYSVTVFGEHQRDFDIEVTYEQTGGQSEILSFKGFCDPLHAKQFTVIVSAESSPHVTVLYSIEPPTGLTATPYSSGDQTLTRLTWNPIPGAINYTVYGIRSDEPYFSKLQTTNAAVFDLSDEWVSADSTPQKFYAVSAVMENGDESFFSEMVGNDDRDGDGLTDIEENQHGTQIDDADSDNDGLNDGDEMLRYDTDPLLTDTDGDTYSDLAEIEGASDPTNENSIPLKGDIDGDKKIDLKDTLLTLQLISGSLHYPVPLFIGNEINGDDRIGLQEVIFTLQYVAGLINKQ